MKKMIIGLLVLNSISVLANDLGSKLKSCDFGFAKIDYSLVDLSNLPLEGGLHVYTSKTKQAIMGEELNLKEVPAMVQSKRRNLVISYPIVNEQGDVEINQSIKVLTRQQIEVNDSEAIYKATMNTLGFKDQGTCRFSL